MGVKTDVSVHKLFILHGIFHRCCRAGNTKPYPVVNPFMAINVSPSSVHSLQFTAFCWVNCKQEKSLMSWHFLEQLKQWIGIVLIRVEHYTRSAKSRSEPAMMCPPGRGQTAYATRSARPPWTLEPNFCWRPIGNIFPYRFIEYLITVFHIAYMTLKKE